MEPLIWAWGDFRRLSSSFSVVNAEPVDRRMLLHLRGQQSNVRFLYSVDLYVPWGFGVFVCLLFVCGRSFSDRIFVARLALLLLCLGLFHAEITA